LFLSNPQNTYTLSLSLSLSPAHTDLILSRIALGNVIDDVILIKDKVRIRRKNTNTTIVFLFHKNLKIISVFFMEFFK
jgi:hypothetical protein